MEPPPSLQFTVNHSRSRIRKVYYGGSPHSCLRTAVAAAHRGFLLVVVMLLYHARPGARSQWEASFWSQIPEAVLESYWPRPLVGKLTGKQKRTRAFTDFNAELCCFVFAWNFYIFLSHPMWDYYGVGFYGEPQKAHLFSLFSVFIIFCSKRTGRQATCRRIFQIPWLAVFVFVLCGVVRLDGRCVLN